MENDTWYWIFHKKQVKEVRKAFQFILQYLQDVDAKNAIIVFNSTAADKGDSADDTEENESSDEPPTEKEITTAVVSQNEHGVRAKQDTYFQADSEDFYLWLEKKIENSLLPLLEYLRCICKIISPQNIPYFQKMLA